MSLGNSAPEQSHTSKPTSAASPTITSGGGLYFQQAASGVVGGAGPSGTGGAGPSGTGGAGPSEQTGPVPPVLRNRRGRSLRNRRGRSLRNRRGRSLRNRRGRSPRNRRGRSLRNRRGRSLRNRRGRSPRNRRGRCPRMAAVNYKGCVDPPLLCEHRCLGWLIWLGDQHNQDIGPNSAKKWEEAPRTRRSTGRPLRELIFTRSASRHTLFLPNGFTKLCQRGSYSHANLSGFPAAVPSSCLAPRVPTAS